MVTSMSTGEPIRILRVIARLNVGGPALHVSYLTKGLDERGYETTLVAGSIGAEEGSMEYAAHDLGIEPVVIPALQREIGAAADLHAVGGLRELIRRLRPDIVHTHTAKAGAIGRAAARLAGGARPPVVVHTFHGHVLRGYFGEARTRVFLEIERALARSTDALIAVSPEVRDELVGLGVAAPEKFVVIRLGLDLEARTSATKGARERERARLGIPDEAFTVGWLGRMTEIKRVDDLLRAFAVLHARDPQARLLLAGDGPLRPSLEGLARELGLGEAAHFLGMRREVAELFAAVDTVALTSANEGTPVTLIEALAAGRPAVSTDVGGVRDVVSDGETGLLVPAGDIGALADALDRLDRDPELRRRFADNGRAGVLSRYSIPRLVDDVDALYGRLLDRKGAARRRASPLPPTLSEIRLEPAERRLKVLLLSQYFPPEIGATQSRMQAFAEYLAKRGHDVTVIAEFPNHPLGVIPPEYRGRLVEDDRSNPYRVLRVWVSAAEEKTPRSRMRFYLSFMALATVVAPLVGRVDVVVATSPPLFTGAAGLALARLNGAPFVLDVRDLWPAAAVSLSQLPSDSALRAAVALERFLYRQAAAVTAVTRPFCEHIDAVRNGRTRTALVPNGTLELFFDAAPEATSRARLGAEPDDFVLTFAGNFGIAQALGSVVEAAAVAEPGIRVALVGEGPMRATLAELAADRAPDRVTLVPQLPLEEVPPLLAASDVLLVTLSGHPTFADFVPSKLIDFMAVGRPVLLAAAGESARLVEMSGAGIVVAPEDPAALAGAAAWLRSHPEEAGEMGRRGRAFARTRMRSRQAARFEQVLLDLSDARRG